ncbi:sulfotransferase family protein [Fulvivirga lutea]|uniref:Sulfotransferase n=1 Tax=Fulvivirga lutea TaxID=2810512 RepID=A0A974WF32_9BACT|nr:sulfotransferase [Fulvivirga lutea]QSE96795.1 sulfotransferase [Fulvivirga lutea]
MKNVFIIGAGRSGTNLLRDILCHFEGVVTWPCDEINYIWKHGNKKTVTDELGVEHARPEVKKYLQNEFEKFSSSNNASILVEKTCANSLRVPFINEIFPEGKYILLLRNGLDVTASALKRWKAPLDIPYIYKKAKWIPKIDIPYYAFNYFTNRLKKVFSKSKSLAFWGPKYKDMAADLSSRSLEEVCALQWSRCVEKSITDLENLGSDKYIKVYYENLVSEPISEVKRIIEFMELNISYVDLVSACDCVSTNSLSKGNKELTIDSQQKIREIVDPIIKKHFL